MLAIDMALTRLLAAYGIQPDMVMGHSLGEYGALIAFGAIPFDDALEAVSARGRGMTRVSVEEEVEFVVSSDGKSSRDEFPLFSDLEGKNSRTNTDKTRALTSGRAIPRPPF